MNLTLVACGVEGGLGMLVFGEMGDCVELPSVLALARGAFGEEFSR